MKSFYGGPMGQSFEIKKVFTSYNQNEQGNGLIDDLVKTWHSPIGIGDFVIISYGAPNTEGYSESLKQDLGEGTAAAIREKDLVAQLTALGFPAASDDTGEYISASFNGTLWQKAYDDSGKNNATSFGGIYYKLITSWLSNTPLIDVNYDVLDANETPRVDVDNTAPDNPKMTFHLPHSWDFAEDVVLEMPQPIELAQDENGFWTYPRMILEDTSTIDSKGQWHYEQTFHYAPIATQEIKKITTEKIKAGEDFGFKLLTGQDGEAGTRTNPIIQVEAPATQRFFVNNAIPVNPADPPEVELTSDGTWNEIQRFQFYLPQAAEYHFGIALSENKNYSETDFEKIPEPEGILIGDYYINRVNGFLYKKVGEKEYTYLGSLQAPAPTIAVMGIDPYVLQDDGSYGPAIPQAKTSVDEATNKWTLKLETTKTPVAVIDAEFIGSSEQGAASVKPISATELEFAFDIPQGSRWFIGTQIESDGSTTQIEEVKLGDVYLNAETGDTFIWVKDAEAGDKWQLKGNIKGVQGDALNVVANYNITYSDTANDVEQIGAYIKSQYTEDIKSQDLFGVNWIDEGNDTHSYWFYQINGVWGRATLTGGTGNLISDTYDSSNPDIKTYSIRYIQEEMIGAENPINDNSNDYKSKMQNTVYSKAQIDKQHEEIENKIKVQSEEIQNQITKMLTWGDFDELENKEA